MKQLQRCLQYVSKYWKVYTVVWTVLGTGWTALHFRTDNEKDYVECRLKAAILTARDKDLSYSNLLRLTSYDGNAFPVNHFSKWRKLWSGMHKLAPSCAVLDGSAPRSCAYYDVIYAQTHVLNPSSVFQRFPILFTSDNTIAVVASNVILITV